MHTYRFEGTYRQIGFEYGLMLRPNRIVPPTVSATRLEFVRACEPHLREHAPELIDEIEGMAEGSGYDIDRLKIAALAPMARPACSVMAVGGQHTADGRPLFGRNLDWYRSALAYAAFCEKHPQGAIASLGATDAFVGASDGMNAAGLAIAITAVMGGRDHPGIMFNLATRIVLDRCRTTEEAVTFLRRIRHARTINFLVADAGGDIAVVEAAPERVHVSRPDNGFAAVTNQYQSEEMARLERVRMRPPNSYRRLCNLREWFAGRQGVVSASDARRILSTPYPHGVCVLPRGRGISTVWSWTAALGSGLMGFASGSPAEEPYRAYALEA